jgi:hypothetical protein
MVIYDDNDDYYYYSGYLVMASMGPFSYALDVDIS